MNIDTFAEWLRRQNHRVIKTESSYWYNAGPRVYQAFPYGWIIQPPKSELTKFLIRNGALALRYSTPLDSSEGLISYHVVLSSPYELNLLDHRARNGVKRGLKACQVEPIPMERLADEGWRLQRDTLERQNRLSSMSQSEWELICRSAIGLPGFVAWGAIIEGVLTASILTARIDDTFYVPYAQCDHEYMSYHVNNALFYVASCSMLATEGIKEIFFSLHSLDAPESTNEFKFRMGLQARPVRQCIQFYPALMPFANNLTHQLVRRLMLSRPSSIFLSKAEGMLRFYVEGKRHYRQQEWPKCLTKIKEELLGSDGIPVRPNIEQTVP